MTVTLRSLSGISAAVLVASLCACLESAERLVGECAVSDGIAGTSCDDFTGDEEYINEYITEVKWGNSPWNSNGTWLIGGRPDQRAVEVAISSDDGGVTFTGTMRYWGEDNLTFRATQLLDNEYSTEVKSDDSSWTPNGTWVIGGRPNQRTVVLDIISDDGGNTFTGIMQYYGEGNIGFRADYTSSP